ncbi:MAG: hypothetical protein COW00_16755 [Bdellovibrio sp. CG12_big_fil_rev_8_21_14_0_65_39_13]|nr:MAG: hypothetical protein COW78_10045 [Bdellovibrio sp. CG22_combo_CG10-13_8_21_14_all_39_27]PIQ58255.1 MAG: hypothetical protein COW00_16755 [Bdellovibrio sp. CG12_big_fil_rev_8_21_14_0_65_39_13]PIR36664.1 MAG: hypothetical protein COV37_02275 [Bdellovibrio sp. CG11_big_fil_rev_8_21_14_0_20_39_38]PJB54133.1 MAG: hypothetical protein CO099_03255 [Bdellovibrio sp. CG_4_9_14_3_um_filter_39_7]
MSKILTEKKSKLSFIIYDGVKAPRYYEISRQAFRTLFWGLPGFSIVSLFIALVSVLAYQQLRTNMNQVDPEVVSQLKKENLDLTQEKASADVVLKELQDKLSQTAAVSDNTPLSILQLYSTVPGANDLSQTPALSMDGFQTVVENGQTVVRFNLVNVTKDSARISGFIFVVLRIDQSLYFYPESSFSEGDLQVLFSNGEIFATSRFRPVEAKFPAPTKPTTALVKILIFSRTGDLMFKRIQSSEIKP